MKSLLAAAVLLFIIPIFGGAETAERYSPWQGYCLFGVGTGAQNFEFLPEYPFFRTRPAATEQVALGAEVVSKEGLGLGFEMGWAHWDRGRPWVRTPSLDLSFHFPKFAHHKIEPFVQAGATLLYEQLGEGRGGVAINVGGGINYWFSRHLALRADVKGFPQPAYYQGYPTLVEFRAGLTLR